MCHGNTLQWSPGRDGGGRMCHGELCEGPGRKGAGIEAGRNWCSPKYQWPRESPLILSNSTRGWSMPGDRGSAGGSGIQPGVWVSGFVSAFSLAGSPILLLFGEDVFEKLIHRPCNGRGGDLVNDSRLNPSEVGGHPAYLVHRPEGISHACDVGVPCQGFLGVEQCFANVQWGGGSGSDSSGASSREHVGAGVVPSLRVKVLLQKFIGHEVDGLEGNIHG